MALGWLESLLFGLISGITELLPVSSEAHQALLHHFFGTESSSVLSLFVHLGTLAALWLCSRKHITKMRRERKLASVPRRRRKREPDLRYILDWRLVQTATVPAVVSLLLYRSAFSLTEKLYWVAIICLLNGAVLFMPTLLPYGNKDSRSMSALDGWIIGLSGALGILPGISRIGMLTSSAVGRGADRHNALNWAMLLLLPVFTALLLVDGFGILSAGLGSLTLPIILKCVLAGLASFGGSCCGISILRFLSVNAGFSAFSYYSWGLGLFTFILYLTT